MLLGLHIAKNGTSRPVLFKDKRSAYFKGCPLKASFKVYFLKLQLRSLICSLCDRFHWNRDLVIKKYSFETIFKGFKTAGMTNKKLFNELFWIMGSEGHKVWSVGFLYELRITGKEFICQEPSMLWHKSKHHQENSK